MQSESNQLTFCVKSRARLFYNGGRGCSYPSSHCGYLCCIYVNKIQTLSMLQQDHANVTDGESAIVHLLNPV
ncbi:unnamed protein product [Brassica oleracea var. botrytis]